MQIIVLYFEQTEKTIWRYL